MLTDRDGEDSLGHMYRMLYARVCRAVSTAMRRSHTTGGHIDELRFRLEAWDDIVGVKKDVLDVIEQEDDAAAARLRDFFTLLSCAFEHVEVMIGLRAAPSDGSSPRQDSIHHFRDLLFTRLSENARVVMASMAARDNRNWEESRESTTHGTATAATSASPPGSGSPGQYHHGLTPAPRSGNSPVHTLTQLDSVSHLDYPSRPSTSNSELAAGAPPSVATPSHTLPFIPELLQAHDSSLETPSTASATSSPMTPFTPYGPAATPITDTGATTGQEHSLGRQRYDSLLMLSPVQIGDGTLAGRHQPLEPPTESSMASQFRGGSAHLQFFSTDSRGKGSPAPSHEPSP